MWIAACATGEAPISITTSMSNGGSGGMDAGPDLGPCGMDCSKVETPQCTVGVCNTGQVVGPLNTCVVVTAPDGTSCDDGKFCTSNDVCTNGACVGGEQNRCGAGDNPCLAVICYEDSQTCDATPANDGAACTPTDLCQVNGVCQIGDCVGEPKDCSFSPLNECNTVSCDPGTGKCVGTPDAKKDDLPCQLTGDVCSVNRTCKTGVCGGGTPKDCSALDVGCQVGVCDSDTGLCGSAPAPIGTACSEGIAECHVGACDVKGACIDAAAGADGVACNDHNACTKADACSSGVCGGTSIAGCVLYFTEGFETCPHGWTFGGDWQCGTPTNVGPATAHTGTNVIATKLDGVYSINQSYNTTVADSPAIDLTTATNPMLSFWVWDHTEGGSFDGWNVKVSQDGGPFTEVTTVSPAYNLTVGSQPAWGGDHSAQSWQNYIADLSSFKGHSVVLRFAFRSDGATVYPGVYLDDLVVAEPPQVPLYISTDSPLPDVYAGGSYSQQLTKTGGDSNVKWSIVSGGASWLSIDPLTGVLKGPTGPTDVGPVSVTVRVEEQPSPNPNYAEKTFTFNVISDLYYTSFEGACPNGWTLTGDWQCGVPTSGPAAAYVGTQCLATKLAGNYSDLQTFSGTTATSPDIDLSNALIPQMAFRMWVDTEGGTHDGFNLQISSNGGMTYAPVTGVTPGYGLTIGGKPAWGGHQSAVGWQQVKVDLAAYAGQVVRLRFAFQSDASGEFPGVYIDDILINN